MIDREHDLPITKQAQVLRISRGSVYYLPRSVSATDLEVMRCLDRLHLEFPFAGSRMLRGLLAAEGCKIGRRHVKTLMKRMGIEALYRRPRTTKPAPGHKIYPYLLRGIEIARPNQVWAMDITYIPMARGFVYLAVVLDWFSRRVLSWRVSITMEAAFCVETLEDALARHGNAHKCAPLSARAPHCVSVSRGSVSEETSNQCLQRHPLSSLTGPIGAASGQAEQAMDRLSGSCGPSQRAAFQELPKPNRLPSFRAQPRSKF
jgi:putative transposase